MIIRNIANSNVLSIARSGIIHQHLGESCTAIIQRNAYSSGTTKKHGKTPPPKPLSSRFQKGNSLTLEHFLLHEKCMKLWRDFLRASRNIPNPIARRETVDWLRDEHFEGAYGLRNETDVTRIRELLVAGNVALKRVCGPMELVAALNPKHGSFLKLRGKRG
ncbi:uncharacterized protein FA14DRAFT_93275 [Meira miltonrushii]|uniref:Complex 1 LYR protein domain-containing protein n=1 Tax=Meira miltonrushii TaxID=1280837 RepID=A0A316V5M6_9BASI|nr:uncharacterized protein FA14DRAFT_93275 [Meira miltonrushii]PWN31811.1 hypothetical protein FA14DRAFT_93275 [Meira miltonrushii]